MIRTQILLTPTLYEEIKNKAKNEGKSFSAVIREVLTKIFIKKKKSGGEILAEIAKKCSFYDPSLPKDLSVNDKYLYGKKSHYDYRRR